MRFYYNPCESNQLHLVNTIQKCGCFAIKLSQWIVSRIDLTENNCETFKKLFNECEIHDFEYTKEVYNKDFKISIIEKYIIDKQLLGSGSIGQVYKAKRKQDNKDVVIKVLHPKVNKNIEYYYNVFLMFINVFKTINKSFAIVNHLNMNDFLCNFKLQTDFLNEAENIKKMNMNFKNCPNIVIPELYEYSENIIVMSYEDGIKLDDVDSFHVKYNFMLLLTILIRKMMNLDGFVHCDLHQCNWCVRPDTMQIVLYDFGYMLDINANKKQFSVDDFTKFYYYYELGEVKSCVKQFMLYGLENNVTESEINEIINDKNAEEWLIRPCVLSKVLNVIIDKLNKHNYTMTSMALELMLMFNNIELFVTKYASLGNVKLDKCYKEMISFCKNYKGFEDLETHFKTKLKGIESSFGLVKTDIVENFYCKEIGDLKKTQDV